MNTSHIMLLCLPLAMAMTTEIIPNTLHRYRASPKLLGPARFVHDPEDSILNQLDESLRKISTIYTQALLSGSYSFELEASMHSMEVELYDQLGQLFKQNRLADYMKYEAEVTRQMIIYNMLKKLFGYAQEELEDRNQNHE